jgi:hypothetical protein
MFLRILTLVAALIFVADASHAASANGGFDVSALYGFVCSADGSGAGSLSELSPGCADVVDAGSFTVSASGEATYDTLRATARVGFSSVESAYLDGSGRVALAQGTARYRDTVTIDVPGRTGEVVDLVFTAALNGLVGASADPAVAFAWAVGGLRTTVNGTDLRIATEAKSDGDVFPFDQNPGLVQITLGTPFAVDAELSVRAELSQRARTSGLSGSAVAEFGNSGGITSFELFDLGGAPILDYDLSSESGAFGFYAVPEPGTAWLLATAVAALGANRRRGRTRAAAHGSTSIA